MNRKAKLLFGLTMALAVVAAFGADTIRTRNTLITDTFKSGQTGGISSQDIRDLTVSAVPSYAASDPTADSDENAATPGPYGVGSVWVNTSDGGIFTCVDATDGAAVWSELHTGTLPIANGGTGAISYTSGKLPYYNGSVMADSPVAVSGTSVGVGGSPSRLFHVQRDANSSTYIRLSNSDGTNQSSRSRFELIAGTVTTELQSIATIGAFFGTSTAHSAEFYTSGSTRLRIASGGDINVVGPSNIGIGTASFGTSAASVLGIANGTVPASSPADIVQLYAEDVSSSSELKVRDEAGNVTTLSPHPHDAPVSLSHFGVGLDEYSASRNHYKGECYWFNLSKWFFDDEATKADCRMIESFSEYNTRRGLSEGDHGYLVVEDWDAAEAKKVEVAREKREQWEAKAGDGRGDKPKLHKAKRRPSWLSRR